MSNEELTKNEAPGSLVSLDQPSSRPVTLADELVAYLQSHPEERLWQAIRNWSGQDYILFGNLSVRRGGKDFATIDGMKVYVHDTYHFTGKES